MARIRFMDGSRNFWPALTSTLTASSAAVGLPATNSQHQDRTKVWRSVQGTGTATLDVDLGSSLSPTCLCVANVKLVGAGALLLYTGATLGSETTLVATMPAQDRDTRTSFAFFSATAGRYWRLKWTNPGSASDYAEIGFVHLGTYFEPTQNVMVPADVSRVDPSVTSESVDGQATFSRRTKVFRGAWLFQEVPEAQLDIYRANWDAAGVAGAFFQVLDTALPWTSWLSRQTGELGVKFNTMSGRYTVGVPWQEVR